MDVHQNAKLTPRGREEMAKLVLDTGLSLRRVAASYQVDPKTVKRWVARYKAEGQNGLQDHSSRPHRNPLRTPRHISRRLLRHRRKERMTMDEIARHACGHRRLQSGWTSPALAR